MILLYDYYSYKSFILYIQIHVGYMTPRKYVISPTRNRMAKAVAKKNRMTVAKEVLTNPVTKKHVVEMSWPVK